MDTLWKTSLWSQFGAAIDMLENDVRACPDELLLRDRSQQPEFWYVAYHALFWLDLYLSGPVEGFTPPAPFMLDELDPAGLMPERPYTKDELLTYLAHCRKKCQTTIETLTDEQASKLCKFPWGELSFAELLLYNMRHTQEHSGGLSLILGQKLGEGPGWIGKARS